MAQGVPLGGALTGATARLRRSLPAAALATLVSCLATAPGAEARSFVPPNGKIFHGPSDTGRAADFNRFSRQVRDHSAIMQSFFHWGVPLGTGALQRYRRTRSRGVVSISTAPGGRPEVIDPKGIASGRGDRYILSLNDSIAETRQVVYIRLMPEMNGHWNPYSGFNADGTSRGEDHAPRWFRRAWQRFALIIRGGKRNRINDRLRKLGLPRIYRAKSNNSRVYKRRNVHFKLGKPKVALMWVPQTRGSPDVPGNTPGSYWPGGRYVDWVGADVFSKYAGSTLWNNLEEFYRRWDSKPFAIGEYSPWDSDPGGAFVSRLFDWAESHGRTRMLVYFRSVNTTNEFNLQYYPDSKEKLRQILNRPRYMSYAPEYVRR